MIINGDAVIVLKGLSDESIQCCVTSPPYYGLRDYGIEGQLGLEGSPEEYVNSLIEVFREVKRVLKGDGTVWLNLGDSYAGGGNYRGINPNTLTIKQGSNRASYGLSQRCGVVDIPFGLKPKDLIGIPWRVAFALQSDGWWLRQDIIWAKPNPMPESITDRCTKAHEYIFLLTKSERYFYDAEAVKEDSVTSEEMQIAKRNIQPHKGQRDNGMRETTGGFDKIQNTYPTRNRRSVWTITTKPFKEAHFATFPPEIPEICIKAGSKEGDIILDPFSGAGTTGLVAERLGRKYIGIELNMDYCKMSEKRLYNAQPILTYMAKQGCK